MKVTVLETGNDWSIKLVLGSVYIYSPSSWRFSRWIWSWLHGRKHITFCDYSTFPDINFLYFVEKRKKEKQFLTIQLGHSRIKRDHKTNQVSWTFNEWGWSSVTKRNELWDSWFLFNSFNVYRKTRKIKPTTAIATPKKINFKKHPSNSPAASLPKINATVIKTRQIAIISIMTNILHRLPVFVAFNIKDTISD